MTWCKQITIGYNTIQTNNSHSCSVWKMRSIFGYIRNRIEINVPRSAHGYFIIHSYNRNNNVDSITLQHNWIFSSFWFNIWDSAAPHRGVKANQQQQQPKNQYEQFGNNVFRSLLLSKNPCHSSDIWHDFSNKFYSLISTISMLEWWRNRICIIWHLIVMQSSYSELSKASCYIAMQIRACTRAQCTCHGQ